MHFSIKRNSSYCPGQATSPSVGMVLTTLSKWFDEARVIVEVVSIYYAISMK